MTRNGGVGPQALFPLTITTRSDQNITSCHVASPLARSSKFEERDCLLVSVRLFITTRARFAPNRYSPRHPPGPPPPSPPSVRPRTPRCQYTHGAVGPSKKAKQTQPPPTQPHPRSPRSRLRVHPSTHPSTRARARAHTDSKPIHKPYTHTNFNPHPTAGVAVHTFFRVRSRGPHSPPAVVLC